MPDTKIDEAIALARRIVDKDISGWAACHAQELARALLDATAPGAQYRAGAEWIERIVLNRVSSNPAEVAIYEAIRAAIAALPASPETAPVAMPPAWPELRWEADYEDSNIELCLLGDFHVGTITFYPRPKPGWGFELQLVHAEASYGGRTTKSEARTAVEAAVRERLGIAK